MRLRIGVSGILLLGLAYGIYNEGLFAKTLIMQQHLPIPAFDGYGVFLGFAVPWAVLICVWHSIASVLVPITFTHALMPESEVSRAWTGKWLGGSLLLALVALGCLNFAGKQPSISSLLQLACLLAAMLLCLFVALCRPGLIPTGGSSAKSGLRAFCFGFSTLLVMALLWTIASMRLSLFVFIAAVGGALWIYVHLFKRGNSKSLHEYVLFGLGFYGQMACFTITARML